MIIVYPDFQGKGTFGEFGRVLLERYVEAGKAILVPVFNGKAEDKLIDLSQKAEKLGFSSVVSAETGLVAALIAGYEHAVQIAIDDVVVRLDTAEHPIEEIDKLAQRAEEIGGMVIGDLSFTNETLVEGSLDEFAHLNLWPTMSRQITGVLRGGSSKGVSVSCAFGYQAFGKGIVRRLLPDAMTIADRASEIAGTPVTWVFDMAMLGAACIQGVPVEIVSIPVIKERNRVKAKIAMQFEGNLAMLVAASEIKIDRLLSIR